MAQPPLPALTDWLESEPPDLLILLECTPAMARWLDERHDLPHQAEQPDESPFGLCVRSAWPLLDARVAWDGRGSLTRGTPVWVRRAASAIAVRSAATRSALLARGRGFRTGTSGCGARVR
jgi:hypothetical protein